MGPGANSPAPYPHPLLQHQSDRPILSMHQPHRKAPCSVVSPSPSHGKEGNCEQSDEQTNASKSARRRRHRTHHRQHSWCDQLATRVRFSPRFIALYLHMKVRLIVAKRLLSLFRISGDAKQLCLLNVNGRNEWTVKDASNNNQFPINTNLTFNRAPDDAK